MKALRVRVTDMNFPRVDAAGPRFGPWREVGHEFQKTHGSEPIGYHI